MMRSFKKVIERLTVFIIGLPLVLSSVYFFPQYHFLLLHIEIFIFTGIGIFELHRIMSHRMSVYPLPLALLIGLSIPLISYLNNIEIFSRTGFVFALTIAVFLIFVIEIVVSFSKPLHNSVQRITSASFIIFYPGFLFSFVSYMTRWIHASQAITVFLFMVFICDSAAWFFGMLFGKKSRGFIPASPKKSIAGFIGGIAASMAAGAVACTIFSEAFAGNWNGCLLLGFATAIAAICGDLIESILKRSADVKDSGAIILGRGGVLDCIDSIILAAPVFYVFYLLCVGQ